MGVGLYIIVFEKFSKYDRVGCGYLLAVEPFGSGIVYMLRYGERQTAFAEAEVFDDVDIAILFKYLVESDYA